MTKNPDIEGYDFVDRPPHRILIREDWREALLHDLESDFRDVPGDHRREYSHGRVIHFSYLPKGASERVFVRQATRGGLVGRLLGGLYLGNARPERELRATSIARKAGVAVAEPLAVRTTCVFGPFWRITVVTREIPQAENLLTLAPVMPPAEKHTTITKIADELRRLHDAGVYHSDLTMKNILRSGSAVYIIDLDKALLRSRRDPTMDIMNLSRLNRSVEKLQGTRGWVSRADKLRFLKRYLGGRERLREVARNCANGLWAHRIWWNLSGQA